MDFLSAFSALERIAIIGCAMLIGYWGYRLLATDRIPALIFMGVACAVLFAALFTGGSHVQRVSESYQLAAATAAKPTAELPTPEANRLEAEVDELDAPQPPGPAGERSAASGSSAAPIALPETEPATDEAPAEPVTTHSDAPTADILSSQELGGRIVSVRSQSVTLEWSPGR